MRFLAKIKSVLFHRKPHLHSFEGKRKKSFVSLFPISLYLYSEINFISSLLLVFFFYFYVLTNFVEIYNVLNSEEQNSSAAQKCQFWNLYLLYKCLSFTQLIICSKNSHGNQWQMLPNHSQWTSCLLRLQISFGNTRRQSLTITTIMSL